MQARVIHDKRIRIIYNSTVNAINGDKGKVASVTLQNQKTGEQTQLPAQGVFIAIGLHPNTALFKNQVELTSYGYIALKGITRHLFLACLLLAMLQMTRINKQLPLPAPDVLLPSMQNGFYRNLRCPKMGVLEIVRL